ncbi:MAG: hypothetical protein ACO26H_03260 [Sediminibacterium sp.]
MSKFENELNLESARKIVLKKKNLINAEIGADKDLSTAIDALVSNTSVKCYIFAKSIAFRVGKSSVKSIKGYSSGFKASFTGNKQSKDVFKQSMTFGSSKNDKVLLAACYFLIEHADRVLSESDKTEAVESEQVVQTQRQLKALIKEYGSVHLKVGDETFQVDDFAQVSGRPKADMTFTFKDKAVVYVSHKKGSKAGDFQQYGGFSSDLNIKTDNDINSHPLIKKFVEDIRSIFAAFNLKKDSNDRYDFNNLVKGSNFARLLDDENMANTVMFGKDFSSGKVGLDNCSILIDGDITFKPIKNKSLNVFELDGSYHSTINPCLLKRKPTFKLDATDIYAPVMFLIKSEQQGLNQGGFSNVRAVIWPNNKVSQGYCKKLDETLKIIKSKNTSSIATLRKEMVK